MIPKQTVKLAANGRWVGLLQDFGVDPRLLTGRHGPCPGCGGKDRFRFDDVGGDGSFLCSQGHGELLVGDGFRLVEHVKGWDWKQAIAAVAEKLGLDARQYREEAPPRAQDDVAPAPVGEKPARELDREKVADFIRGVPEITDEFLRRRSPIDPAGLSSIQFLEALFKPDEKVLIFAEQWTQGDFLAWIGKGQYRLADVRGVQARKSGLPKGGKRGVWYQVQPVTGAWAINAKRSVREEDAKWTRRSEVNITAWRHYVLESDVDGFENEWRRVVGALALPIAAIYTSGGRSIHALVQCEVLAKSMWDVTRDALAAIVCPLGADPGAMSAVRLSRLPGCLREGKDEQALNEAGEKVKRYKRYPQPQMQRLLYLNPEPGYEAIWTKREVRGV